MIFVNIDDHEPEQDWLDRADALTDQLINAATPAERATIIQDNQAMWGELKEQFCNVLQRKCWYSESVNDFAHCHVDHFRPKSSAIDENGADQGGYWWLAFNWRNYRYSAPAGNVRKRDYFHVNANKANLPADAIENEDIRFLDPTEPEDPGKLKFDNEGIISPKERVTSARDYIQAEYTIRRMNLNMEGLKEGRKDRYRKTARLIRQVQNLLALQTINYDMARKQSIRSKQLELLELAGKYSPYSAAVKYCLKESGLDWALSIAIAS
ncbi:MAG: hypothetical protein IPI45_06190 [Saprospiraceae bacterium]|nr:hypothetical protein [Saprospiraceae bacterium]MBK7737349.1 hypothetical protein [Saprospiraceae bacterium]MBK7914072.1 hypothetical protein [Saprospiraceae bacterium]